jgi:molybdopterin-containing oxidoreductase family iron-sulfur binding subunit
MVIDLSDVKMLAPAGIPAIMRTIFIPIITGSRFTPCRMLRILPLLATYYLHALEEPPCVKVCPVDATFRRQDGIVLIDSDRCIGCRFCMAACPYSTRVFNWNDPNLPEEIASQHYSCESSVPQKKGTVGKCDFCPDMARKGELPHCVSACPNGVFFFGDMNEDTVTNGAETFQFSELIKDKAGID